MATAEICALAQEIFGWQSWRKHCFEAAGTFMTELPFGVEAILVHGLPIGRGGDAAGQLFVHAWVEIGDDVFDLTVSPNPIPKPVYYALGRIQTVVCFTRDQHCDLFDEHGHHGPWPESPVGATLERPA